MEWSVRTRKDLPTVALEDVDLSVLNEKADAFIANVTARCNSPVKAYALCEDGDRLKRILSKGLYAKWAIISSDTVFWLNYSRCCLVFIQECFLLNCDAIIQDSLYCISK